MENKKDLSTLIQESEKHLTVQPSTDAWNRLENRLEAVPKKQNGRLVFLSSIRFLSIAASLALLIGAVYFFQNENALDVTSDTFKPTLMETLTGAEDCNPYCAVMRARKELPEEYARRVGR